MDFVIAFYELTRDMFPDIGKTFKKLLNSDSTQNLKKEISRQLSRRLSSHIDRGFKYNDIQV